MKALKQRSRRKQVTVPQGIGITMPDSGISYAETTRKLKENLDLGKIGVIVTDIEKTQAGHLIVSVRGKEKAAKATAMLKIEAKRVLDHEAAIRVTIRPVHLEILNISCMDNIEDVIADTKRDQYPNEGMRLLRLVPVYGRTQRDIIQVSSTVANNILKKGALKIRFVSCRVRLRETKLRDASDSTPTGTRFRAAKFLTAPSSA